MHIHTKALECSLQGANFLTTSTSGVLTPFAFVNFLPEDNESHSPTYPRTGYLPQSTYPSQVLWYGLCIPTVKLQLYRSIRHVNLDPGCAVCAWQSQGFPLANRTAGLSTGPELPGPELL
jgi:hypothetical protein